MFRFRLIAATAFVVLISAVLPARADAPPPVVVELFTSQGCSSCPPADDYLGQLAQQPGVLALAFHVPYWNYIGWTDPFAKPWAAARQRGYMRSLHQPYVYTPQMVVNGTAQAIGSERSTIEALIRAAAATQPPHPDLMLRWRDDGALIVAVGAGPSPPAEPATLWLVGFDRPHETKILRGENAGRTLIDYNAVRSFRRLGAWAGWSSEMIVPAAEARGLGNAGIAVLLQARGTGPILTAAEIPQR